jgi:outer membrane lipoprotein
VNRILLILSLTYLLQACSSTPAALRDAPELSPSLKQVQQQSDAYIDRRLRWGGTIVQLENLPDSTIIEIVARRLWKNGEPKSEDHSEGRFLARIDRFLDPAIYGSERSITVVGRLQRIEKRQLGQMYYQYPVVTVESHHLWPEPEPCQECYDPFLHDPFFYDPWYPFGYPYPYYHRRPYY